MALVRWDAATELAGMELDRLNRMFSDLYEGSVGAWMPRVDIYETDDKEVVIKADLPEMSRDQIDVTFENNVLTIKGERRLESSVKQESFHRTERQYGRFTRSFTVPNTIDTGRITAAYKDGVLTIRLPQREEAKPKQVPVQ